MSGFEVVGVVLASLPLVIAAMEHYAGGIESLRQLRSCRLQLKRYSMTLRAEWWMFCNTIELVLEGVVGPVLTSQLVQNPSGKEWKDEGLSRKLKHRLANAYDVFFEFVLDILGTISDFKSRLNLDSDGQASGSTSFEALAYFYSQESSSAPGDIASFLPLLFVFFSAVSRYHLCSPS
jgi:hypothetical protein